jgi:hypothetical protein
MRVWSAVAALVSILTFPSAVSAQLAPQPPPVSSATVQTPPRDRAQALRTGTGRITGRVVTADTGAPVRRAQLRLYSPEIAENHVAATDPQGRYEFTSLPAGRYMLTASKAGFVTWSYGAERANDAPKPIELADSQTLEKIDFVLTRGSVITGRVLDEFGEPVSEAQVTVSRYQYTGGRRQLMPVRSNTTNDLGQFRIFGLAPGDYYLSATLRTMMGGRESEDRSGYAPTYYPGTANPAEAQRFTVKLGQEIASADFAMIPTRLAQVSGTAVDSQGKPLSGMVSLMPRQPVIMVGGGAPVRPDGSFAISSVVPGEYTIVARTAGPGGESEIAMAPLQVTGGDITGISLQTTKGATLRGLVTFEGGTTTGDPTTVMISGMSAEPGLMLPGSPPARVNQDGTFELRGLVGSRLIRAGASRGGWTLKAVIINGRDVTDTPLEFKGTEETVNAQIILTGRQTSLSGTVVDSRGDPAKDYMVIVFPDDRQRVGYASRFLRNARGDQEGRYRIQGLPAGEYLAVAVPSSQDIEWNNPDVLEQLRPGATRFSLAEGEKKTVQLMMSVR